MNMSKRKAEEQEVVEQQEDKQQVEQKQDEQVVEQQQDEQQDNFWEIIQQRRAKQASTFRAEMPVFKKPKKKPSDFASLYGMSLFRIAYLFTFNDGSDGDWPPPRHVYNSKAGEWRVILQSLSDGDGAALIFQRTDKQIITMKMIEKDVAFVNDLLVQSFEDALVLSKNKWFKPLDQEQRTDVNNILNITKPLHLSDDRKSLKLNFEFSGLDTCNMQAYWFPMRLGKWLNAEEEMKNETIHLPFAHMTRADPDEMYIWMHDLESFCNHNVE